MPLIDYKTDLYPTNLDQPGRINLKSNRDEKSILEYVNKIYNNAYKERLQFEKQWFTNLAFYFGRHYVQWVANDNANFAKLYEPPTPPWRVRLVINKVRTIIRTELVKVTKENPRGFATPASSDDDDIVAARGADRIIEHQERQLQLRKVRRQSMFWTLTCGTGFGKIFWDSGLIKHGYRGSIVAEPVSPFYIYVVDMAEQEIENQPVVIHTVGKDPDWIKSTFNKEVTANASSGKGETDARYLSALGIQATSNRKIVSVRETWIKPCEKFKQGAFVLSTNDSILYFSEGMQYQHGEYPFTKFDSIPTGRFYSDSIIVDVIPLQREYNKTRSQIVEAKNKMGKPQIIAPKGSIDVNKWTSEPGLVLLYTPGLEPPKPLELSSLPSYVLQEVDRIQADINDLSSQHEITKGSTPPGVTAATAIAYLQEEDDSKLSPVIASLEEGVQKMNNQILSHVVQFWIDERTVKTVGEGNIYEISKFKGSDIEGNSDWVVESGSATPRSRAAKQAFLMELHGSGVISPQQMLKYMDMAETGRMYEDAQIDVRQAQRENLIMKDMAQQAAMNVDPMTGQPMPLQPMPANKYDNHLSHIAEHDNFRKKESYEMLPEQAKQMWDTHVTGHKLMVAAMFGQVFQFQQDPATGMISQYDPRLDGFITQVAMGQIPPVQGQGPPQQQSGLQDAAQQR